MRSWMGFISSLAAVVMMTQVRNGSASGLLLVAPHFPQSGEGHGLAVGAADGVREFAGRFAALAGRRCHS